MSPTKPKIVNPEEQSNEMPTMPGFDQDDPIELGLQKIAAAPEAELRTWAKEVYVAMNTPPMLELPVVGEEEYKGKKMLVVLKGSERLMAGNLAGKVPVGETAWVHAGSMVTLSKTARKAIGQVQSIKAIRDKKALIAGHNGEERWVDISEYPDAKPGQKVSILNDWTIIDVWQDPTQSEVLEKPTTRYSDIGGQNKAIVAIRKAIELPRKNPDAFKALGIRPASGILLYGPPGCGKTMLGKAVAGETGSTFFSVKISDILSKWVGQSEANVREIFQAARHNAPSIVFFDEFDALGSERSDSETARYANSVVAELLSQMDGLEERGQITLIAATNRPELVDPAFKRPGRFDVAIEVARPDRAAAAQIAKIYLHDDLPYDGDGADVVREALLDHAFANPKVATEMSGAIIEGFANEIKMQCIVRCGNKVKLSVKDVENAAVGFLNRK